MFSYSFAVKLTDRKIADCPPVLFESEPYGIKIERKESDVLLVSSAGYASEVEALQQLATMLMKTKITLLNLKVPHLDWFSFDSTQRLATNAIGKLFESERIVAISYRPQAYETNKFPHWPGAMPAASVLDLETLRDISLPEEKFNFGTGRTLEALNVLSLALADPHAKSKLILAMTAIEVLSDRANVEEYHLAALDALKEKIPEIITTNNLKEKLAKTLEDAKLESISKAGKRLIKEVLGSAKAKRFYELYDARSKLAHGDSSCMSIDLEGHQEIEKLAEEGFQLALELALKFREPIEFSKAAG
ncbi:HEPN domain-containing protein [Pseudomonas oryzihabitans]|uniref:HEPN domain-containing protein n=1 Tax=Pseudomonas oryzihabitans TaxID=47885 RepID=UPI0011A933D2|nr:HEPN domain-containing protein [Pseudomonas oryzihabitans]